MFKGDHALLRPALMAVILHKNFGSRLWLFGSANECATHAERCAPTVPFFFYAVLVASSTHCRHNWESSVLVA